MLVDGVEIYGGFAGDETSISLREFSKNRTILSGDIDGQNDNGMPHNGNSYHVITGAANAKIDGFTIKGGYANGSNPDDCGGGIYNSGVALTVQNCHICTNYAQSAGGGVYNEYSGAGTIDFINCLFSGNAVDTQNSGKKGGALYNLNSNANLINCTLSNNIAYEAGGIYNDSSSVILSNCILWDNRDIAHNTPTLDQQIKEANCTSTVTYSCIQDDTQNDGIVPYDLINGNKDVYPEFIDPGHWDGIIQPDSIPLQVSIRDFIVLNETTEISGYTPHPDFECSFNGQVEMGIVGPIGEELDGNKPIYALGSTGQNDSHPDEDSTHGEHYFNQWYRTTEGVNLETTAMLELEQVQPGIYEYRNTCFFPIDDHLFGSNHSGENCGGSTSHNFHFTMELHTTFTYLENQEYFKIYESDDDLFIYIAGKLVIDIGGIHGAKSRYLEIRNDDTQGGDAYFYDDHDKTTLLGYVDLNLQNGQTYPFDLFFAERHTTQSHLDFSTTMKINPNLKEGNYNLKPVSPCIDAGDNAAIPVGVEVDLGNHDRKIDDLNTYDTGVPYENAPCVDIGAYEYQPPVTNQAPDAVDDSAFTTMNVPVEIDVLSNDVDPDGDAIEISNYDADSLYGGTVELTDDGLQVLYTPPADFTGVDNFTYEICEVDNSTAAAAAQVFVTVSDLTVEAGSEKSLILPQNTVYLFDAKADGGLPGSVISCQWQTVRLPLGVSVTYLPDDVTDKTTVVFDVNPEVFAVETPAVAALRLKAFENGIPAGQDDVRILIYPGGLENQSGPSAEIDPAEPDTGFMRIPARFRDDGRPHGYLQAAWSQISGPGQAAFSQERFIIRADQGQAITIDTQFDATTNVTFTAAGTYKLKLTASDGSKHNNAYIDVEVTGDYLNQPPIVEAGKEIIYTAGADELTVDIDLSGDCGYGTPHSSVVDPDGDSLNIQWTKVSGPSGGVSIDDVAIAAPVLTFDEPGNYVLKLQASDGFYTVEDLLSVSIAASSVSMSVDAGPEQYILLPSDVSLTAQVFGDIPDDPELTWSLIKRPVWGQVSFGSFQAYDTTVSFENRIPGTYVFQFEVKKGLVSVSDTVTVNVYPGIQVSGGLIHSLLRDEDGYVWSFGKDTSPSTDTGFGGVLGRDYNTTSGSNDFQPYPKRVYKGGQDTDGDYLKDIKQVSAGVTHSLALEEGTGKVWAWGGDQACMDELGRPQNSGSYVWFDEPAIMYANQSDPDFPESQIDNISSIVAASKAIYLSGVGYSLILDNNQNVLACGDNQYGQLGFETTGDPYNLPSYVMGEYNTGTLGNIIAIDGGLYFGVALEKYNPYEEFNGYVFTWGSTEKYFCKGALGRGNITGIQGPAKVKAGEQGSHDNLQNIIQIAAGQGFCMALEKYDPDNEHYGRVLTWGWEKQSTRSSTQGDNFDTEALGNGSGPNNEYEPVYVINGGYDHSPDDPEHLSGIIAISAGEGHAMALEKYDPDNGYYGRVFTWGANKYYWTRNDYGVGQGHGPDAEACGVLGNGITGILNSPVPVFVQAGEQDPENPESPLRDIVSIDAGAQHCMAVDKDGNVWAWGVNGSGQLGTGDRNSCARPRLVTFGQKVHNVTQNTWHLGEIQPAIQDAEPGDELVVYPGQYTEAIVCNKPLIIHSIDPSDWDIVNKTVIDGSHADLGEYEALVNITVPEVVLRGFTIQHSPDHGIQMTTLETGGNPILISNNIITENRINGIDATSSDIQIINNFICKNGQHGINFASGSARMVTHNTIVLNYGFGVNGPCNVQNCIAWNNILGQLENCDYDYSIIDDDPGLVNAPYTVDKTVSPGIGGGRYRLYVDSQTLGNYTSGQIIEYADDGVARVVINVDAVHDYVLFSPELPSVETESDELVSIWYPVDSIFTRDEPDTFTSGNGDGYDGNTYMIEVSYSERDNFEVGDIIRYVADSPNVDEYRQVIHKDIYPSTNECFLFVYNGSDSQGLPFKSDICRRCRGI